MLLLMSTDVIAQSNTPPPSSRQEGIPMSVVSAKRPCNRMPAQPIYVYQDGRTLMFDEEHAGDTVTVMEGDNVIFTATIGSDCRIEIPSDITGEVMVMLACGDKEYCACIEFWCKVQDHWTFFSIPNKRKEVILKQATKEINRQSAVAARLTAQLSNKGGNPKTQSRK